jgi:hypothetical protein
MEYREYFRVSHFHNLPWNLIFLTLGCIEKIFFGEIPGKSIGNLKENSRKPQEIQEKPLENPMDTPSSKKC